MAQQKRLSWTDTPPRDWGEHQARVIAWEIKRLRRKRSAQWLADRTKELGYEVSRSTISDLENGRRRYITTAELVVLSAALDTAPCALAYPPAFARGSDVELLPGIEVAFPFVSEWFSGETRIPFPSPDDGAAKEQWARNVGYLQVSKRLGELYGERQRMLEELKDHPTTLRTMLALQDKMIDDYKRQLGLEPGDDA